jgi:hypothetical protein
MSYTFTLNRDAVINGALRLCGVIGEGETPSATQIDNAAEQLNSLVKNWEVKGLSLWAIKSCTMSLTAGKNSYNTTTDLNIEKPMKLMLAYIHDVNSNSDIRMQLLTRDEYTRLGVKSSTGVPTQIWYVPNLNDGTVTIYPTPDAGNATTKQVIMWYQRPFLDMANGTDIVDFPNEWIRPLTWGLASDLAEEYSLPANKKQWIEQKAQMMIAETLSYGEEEGSLFFEPQPKWSS